MRVNPDQSLQSNVVHREKLIRLHDRFPHEFHVSSMDGLQVKCRPIMSICSFKSVHLLRCDVYTNSHVRVSAGCSIASRGHLAFSLSLFPLSSVHGLMDGWRITIIMVICRPFYIHRETFIITASTHHRSQKHVYYHYHKQILDFPNFLTRF